MSYPTPYHSPIPQSKNLQIHKLLIIETGTYNQQYTRPFRMNLQADALDALQHTIDDSNVITSNMLSGVANQFIRPAAQPEAQININNGWDTKRLRFLLQISYERGGFTMHDVILGYTDYAGVSHSLALDPQMKFHVNSVVNQRQSVIATPTGHKSIFQTADASHVLASQQHASVLNNTATYHLRPEDIYKVMPTVGSFDFDQSQDVVDLRVVNSQAPVFSKRNNSIASHYVAQMLNGYRTGAATAYGAEEEAYAGAMGMVKDKIVSQNVFLNKLSQLQGMGGTATFTLGDLRNIDPNLDYVTKVVPLGNVQQVQRVHQAGQTAHWHASDAETQYAAIISQSIPAMMMDFSFAQVRFVSTNNVPGGQITTNILAANSFAQADMRHQAELLKARIDSELIRDLTYENQIPYSITAEFDLLGQSSISISLNNQQVIEYAVPSFADAMFAPVLTTNAAITTDLSRQFNNMVCHLNFNGNDASYPTGFDGTESFPIGSTGYSQSESGSGLYTPTLSSVNI